MRRGEEDDDAAQVARESKRLMWCHGSGPKSVLRNCERILLLNITLKFAFLEFNKDGVLTFPRLMAQ